ncbi:LolA family protein [Peterkaempfera bronchialis]|uniref:LolA family protein n=1 Tax=Peterkaempfera bronchialis TaxID=2126346 RepID=UPI003C2DEF46
MAAKRTNPMADDDQDEHGLAAPYRPTRRTVVRVLMPVGVAAIAAASIGLVPALASDTAPTLPPLSAEQLVAKVLASDPQALSGTVRSTADLGLPGGVLGEAAIGAGGGGGGPFGGHSGADGQRDGGGAAPEAGLTRLLAGTHTLQVAVDGPDRQRLGLIDRLSEYEVVHNGAQVWGWDSRTNEAVHLTLPTGNAGHTGHTGHTGSGPDGSALFGGATVPATPQQAARQVLALAGPDTAVSVGGTTRVAGRNAYELSVKPKQSGSTIGDVRIAVDAGNGVPLRVRVKPAGGGDPVFDVAFTSVSFERPGARTFDFSPPKGAKVTEHRAPAGDLAPSGRPGADHRQADGLNVIGTGWTSVASLTLPADLTGGDGNALALVKGFGKPVAGGTLIHSRLVNALITDSGRVYVGAVSQQVLEHAAGAR